MDSLILLQSASEVSVPQRTTGQLYMTALVVLVAIAALAIAYRRTQFSRLPSEQAKHKSALLGSLRAQTPETVRIPSGEDPLEYREKITEAFERAFARARGESDAHDPDRVTVREAAGSVVGTLHAGIEKHRLHRFVPDRLTFALMALAVSIIVLAPPAMSTETIVAFLESGGEGGLSYSLEWLATAGVSVGSFVWSLLTAFPYAADAFALGLTGVLITGELLFANWFIAVCMALVGWGALYWVGRETTLENVSFYSRRDFAIGIVAVGGSIWLAGVLPTVTLAAAGHAEAGGVLGITLATLVTLVWVFVLAADALERLQEHTGVAFVWPFARGSDEETDEIDELFIEDGDPSLESADSTATEDGTEGDYTLAAYLVCRRVFAGVTALLLPLPFIYAATGVSSGAYSRVLSALFSGQPVAAAVLFVLFLTLVGLVYAARDAHEDVRDALIETLSRQTLRVAIFQRGLTVFTLLVSYVVLWGFTQSYVIAPIGSLVLAVAVYAAYEGIDRAAYRLELFGREETRTGVLIQAYAPETADGEREPVAQIGRKHRTSRETIVDTVDDTLEIAEAVACDTRSVPLTLGQKRAEDLLELGLVDGDVDVEVPEQVRKAIVYELKIKHGGKTDIETLEDALSDLPENVWREELQRLILWNFLSRHGDTVRLERDCWSVDERDALNYRFSGVGS